MQIGRVIGKIVSVIHDTSHDYHKFLLIHFLDAEGKELNTEYIFADYADAGFGDIVLVSMDGGTAEIIFELEDSVCVLDGVIIGVVDEEIWERGVNSERRN